MSLFTGRQMMLIKPLMDAQRKAVAEALVKYKDLWTIEEMLTYSKDCLGFYAYDVEQKSHKNLTNALNTICNKKIELNGKTKVFLIRCHRGAGSYARYVFPRDMLEKIIKEIDGTI